MGILSKEEKQVSTEIAVELRGGRIVKVPLIYNSIVPKVKIEEEEFDFGNIILQGNTGTLTMTLKNESSIPGTLILDFRTKTNRDNDGVDCLKVELIKNDPVPPGGKPGAILDDDDIMINIYEDEDEIKEADGNQRNKSTVLGKDFMLAEQM